jgi:hypothetical protein
MSPLFKVRTIYKENTEDMQLKAPDCISNKLCAFYPKALEIGLKTHRLDINLFHDSLHLLNLRRLTVESCTLTLNIPVIGRPGIVLLSQLKSNFKNSN